MSYNKNNSNSNNDQMKKLESRLTLKKNNEDKREVSELGCSKDNLSEKENTDMDDNDASVVDASISKRSNFKRSASPNNDDSLSDFKLPKLISKPYLSDDKVKLLNNKKSSVRGNGGKTRGINRKKVIDKTPIQSLFFKQQTDFTCPLCLKLFNDINTQTTHTKNCAAKNNVSTEKLLAAVELQGRQAEERLAIGLPAAPFQQVKKKSSSIKKMVPDIDPDIQLAIALSKSLSELEEREYFDEASTIAAESNEKFLQMSSSQRKSTLQNFGFITNKPIIETAIEKPRRKKHFGPTILQTRTQETRERLLSDKIAEVLVGNESITQLQLAEQKIIGEYHLTGVSLQSNVLKKMYEPNSKLWQQSSNIEEHSAYYVEDLCKFISPINQSKGKIIHSNENEQMEIKIDNVPMAMEIIDELPSNIKDDSSNSKPQSQLNKLVAISGENNSLAFSWSKMINSNAYSDVIIHVKNNRYIYCHEIVLWTRCQTIQQDLILNDENNQQRKKIHWPDINFLNAIAFLEFIYCGNINFDAIENNEDSLNEILTLATRYQITELINYLNEKIIESKSNKLLVGKNEVEMNQCNNEIELLINQNKSRVEIPDKNNSIQLHKSLNISRQVQYSRISTSPDMFEDMEIYNCVTNNDRQMDSSGEEALDVLVDLVKENKILSVTGEMNDNFDDEKLSETSSAMNRTKSNMTAFIEKVKKTNIKDILDSDSDSEISVENMKNYQINPFKVKNQNENLLLSDSYWENRKIKTKSALSLLEDDIRACTDSNLNKLMAIESENNNSNESIEQDNDEEVSNIFSNTQSDEGNESIYTKYKRTHRKNSIDNYRGILRDLIGKNSDDIVEQFHEDNNSENNDGMDMNCDDKDSSNRNTTGKHEISSLNKMRLAELSAFDIYEAMPPSPLNTSNDSEKIKSSSPSKDLIDLTEFSDDESPRNNSSHNKQTFDVNEKMTASKSEEKNSLENINVDMEFSNWSSEMSDINDWQPLTQSNILNKNSDDRQNNLYELSDINSIDLTQSDDEENVKVTNKNSPTKKYDDTVTENVTRLLKDYGVLDSTGLNVNSKNQQNNNSIAIVVCSSPETESIDDNINSGLDKCHSSGEADKLKDFEIENNFMEYVMEGGAENSILSSSDNNIELSNTSQLNINDQHVTLTSFGRNVKSPIRTRCSSVLLQEHVNSTRLLTRKSQSEGNFKLHKNKDELIVPTNELFMYLNLSMDDCEISFDISSRENYNGMSSAELNERLAEYGLRNQKPHRAIKLLNYIYDQLNPIVPEHLLSTKFDKVFPTINTDNNIELNEDNLEFDSESSDNSSMSSSLEIADGMMNLSDGGEEYCESDVILLRESFQKLLDNDRVLHNKILMYESIPLESIHKKLKDDGIKSGVELFADYLDDECISFYVEKPKNGRVKSNKLRKNK